MVAGITLPATEYGYSYGSRDGTRSRSGPCTNGNRPSKKDISRSNKWHYRFSHKEKGVVQRRVNYLDQLETTRL